MEGHKKGQHELALFAFKGGLAPSCNISIQSVAMPIKSAWPVDVKMLPVHDTKGSKQMIQTQYRRDGEDNRQGIHIKAFLNVSRNYLLLSQSAAKVKQVVQPLAASAPLHRATMRTYRKAVQSLLLAAGVGFFAAGPVMADPGCDHMRDHSEHHAKMMEAHHASLHKALKLSAEQEPAWNKLMQSEQAGAAMPAGQDDWSKLKAPERAEKMLEMATARQARMAEHVTALKAFYGVLSSEQQKVFDDFHAGPRDRMMGKPGARAPRAGKPAPGN